MSSEPLAELDHVSKRYLLGQGRGALAALRGALGVGRRARHADDRHWALRDLDLSLRPGDSLGIVGRNGAGKTTALRLLAGITRPTRGQVRTRGRVASLLNVGAGFHPELTGRENVLLNGVILGLTRAQVRERYTDIVRFAGIEPFMDTPVKRYSSGMYARLAFSVAAHVEPDLLLVDEVLSVGDAAFQDASLRRMLSFAQNGRTAIVFVSHNLNAIERMCDRAIWLDRGRVAAAGHTSDVLRAYLDAVDEESEAVGETYLTADSVDVLDRSGIPTATIDGQAPFTIRVSGSVHRELAEPVFVVTIRGDHGPLFAGNMHIDGNWPTRVSPGPFTVECAFGPPNLRAGRYQVELKVKQNVRTNYYEPRVKAHFLVPGETGPGGAVVPYAMIGGC